MSQDDVKAPTSVTAADPYDNALKLAQDFIRKLDKESTKKLEQVSAEDKLHDQERLICYAGGVQLFRQQLGIG